MDWDEIEQAIQQIMDRESEILALRYDGKGHGVVLWQRADSPVEYIVHRWATEDTDGNPVRDGIMFYSGGYYVDLKGARLDFRNRSSQ